MAAQPQTLALAGLILLNFLLTAAALYVQLRRLVRTRRRGPQHQPVPQPPAPAEGEGEEHADEGGREKQRRRRRARRRRQPQEEGVGGGGDGDVAAAAAAAAPSAKAAGREGKAEKEKEELLPRRRPQFPLASVAGALQRRINARYDDLARASEARCLTIEQRCRRNRESGEPSIPLGSKSGKKGRKAMRKQMPEEPPFPLSMLSCAMKRRIRDNYAEFYCATITGDLVNEFLNCLIDARNELLQRCENVQRSFKIKKAMLSNHRNYRSSYDRLFEQVRRLEAERDNLKKDAAIYNYIQERLQKSVPYKMIMELSAMEMEAPEISFEELLAKEKEDTAFWHRDGKMRSISSK